MRAPIVWTMIFSMTLMPIQATFAGQEVATEQVRLQNVELNEAGTVTGRLTDPTGQPLANKEIQITTKNATQKKTTDAKGEFVVSAQAGGNCAITVDKQTYACRMWQHNTAPPKALTSFGIVYSEDSVVRGQYDDCGEGCDDGAGGRFGKIGGVSGGQLLGLGLLAGAVVAIVIAANNDDDAS